MHPKALLDSCAELVKLCLTFEHPADAVVSRYFREHRALGPRERATLAETAFAVLRKKLLFEQLARSGSGPKERRLAILGFHGHRDFLKSALTESEKVWLDGCDRVKPDELLAPHRHNLPEWLVAPLKAQLGDEFWALVASLDQTAPLDLRVNALQAKREVIQAELKAAGIPSSPTPYSPWGLRVQGKPSLSTVEPFVRGDIEVQDEGSQLLVMLVDPKRGEMVVDFCAGAGGKTLALAAAMDARGQLIACDSDRTRLSRLTPRAERAGAAFVETRLLDTGREVEALSDLAQGCDLVLVDAPCPIAPAAAFGRSLITVTKFALVTSSTSPTTN